MKAIKIIPVLLIMMLVFSTSLFSQSIANVTDMNDLNKTKVSSDKFSFQQIRINPLSKITTINFTTTDYGKTVLKVCDKNGNTIYTVLDIILEPGSYTYTLDPGDLPQGANFYVLTNEKNTVVEKLVSMK